MLTSILAMVLMLLLIVAMACAYFLPFLIAHDRKLKDAGIIFILNLFFGASGFIWVACLLWAYLSDEIEE